jgi:hypothetical protein
MVVFSANDALVSACHGSSKTQNIEDAIAHAESSKPLARLAAEQVPAVREQRAVAHRLSVLRILSRPAGTDARGQISCISRLKSAKSRTDENRPRRDGR